MSKFNREEWLNKGITELLEWFKINGYDYDSNIHVSVGHTKKKNAIGITHATVASSDGTNHVFVAPTINDSHKVLEVLTHEIVHCIDDCQHSHGRPFIAIAKDVGLVGPWTATTASDRLTERLNTIVEKIGTYDSPVLVSTTKAKGQGTRMLKLVAEDCGYIVRTTQKWLNVGVPTCPHGIEMELSE